MAGGPQCFTLSTWPDAMSFRLFGGCSNHGLFTSSIHPSIFFARAATFGLFQAIRRHFLQANGGAWVRDSKAVLHSSRSCMLLCSPMASPVWPNTCCPSCVTSWGCRSFVQPRCQLGVTASLNWESSEQPFLQAGGWGCSTVSALYGSGPPSLGLLPLPSGIYSCAWSKSLQAFVVTPVHYAHTSLHLCACYALRCKVPLGVHPVPD